MRKAAAKMIIPPAGKVVKKIKEQFFKFSIKTV